MKTVADTFDVSRSNLIEQIDDRSETRKAYIKSDDVLLMPAIRESIRERPSYGYHRITALLNRRNRSAGVPLLNHKRIYRLMRLENLLLQKCTGRRNDRAHDGVIRTLRYNTRWCSDGFEIHC